MSILAVKEGVQEQNSGEEIAWIFNVVNWTSAPTSTSVPEVIDRSTGKDVKSKVMPTGSTSVSGNNITLPILKSLTAGRSYNVFVLWTDGSEKKEAVMVVKCLRRDE